MLQFSWQNINNSQQLWEIEIYFWLDSYMIYTQQKKQ